MSFNIRVPHLLFFYTAIVLAALLLICVLYQEKTALQQELYKWQHKSNELKIELEKINRYATTYGTEPATVSVVLRETEKYGIDPAIMLELIKTESDFDPKAVSSHGAIGLCQLMPVTARELSAELGIGYQKNALYDVEYNIQLAAYYLSKLLKMNDNDIHKALTAYNRGPSGLIAYIQKTGTAKSTYSIRISENSLQQQY